MKLNEMMTTDVEVVNPESSLADAAKRMRRQDIGVLPVCDGTRLVGMITDRDITIRAIAEDRDPKQTKVKDCMSSDLVYCFDDQTETEAEQIMQEKQIRRLPIISREKQLVGIVSLGDLAKRGSSVEEAGETLRRVSQPPGNR